MRFDTRDGFGRAARSGLALLCAAFLGAACGDDDAGGDGGTDAGTDTETDAGADTDSAGWDPRFDLFALQLQADLAASDAYGVSAAVMEDGVVTFAEAFGSRDPDGAEPLTPDTLMQIGSTTKQMTATALLQKVEAGLLSVDDTLEELLPELEFALDGTWDDQITVHHMLSQQSGLFDWIPWDAAADDALLAGYTYGTYDNQFFLMNPPGAFWNYSNPNFVLAGLVTETLDTRAWPDIMAEDVFAPLGMDRTFLRKTEVEADGDYALSYGYGADDIQTGLLGPVAMADMPDPAWARPAGLVWTTPTQLLAWAKFVMDGDPAVLPDELRAAITTAQVDTLYGEGTTSYGYGMFVETGYLSLDGEWYVMPVWEHGGNTLSFTNILYILPEQRLAIAITSSAYGTDFSPSLDTAIRTIAELPAPSEAWEYEIDPAKFDDHVGTYTDPYNVGDMIVTREGDTLLAEMPLLTAAGYDVTPELVPISSDIFYLYIDGSPFDITFIAPGGGGPSLYARNRSFVTTRVEEEPDAGAAELRAQPSREAIERWMRRARLEPAPIRLPSTAP